MADVDEIRGGRSARVAEVVVLRVERQPRERVLRGRRMRVQRAPGAAFEPGNRGGKKKKKLRRPRTDASRCFCLLRRSRRLRRESWTIATALLRRTQESTPLPTASIQNDARSLMASDVVRRGARTCAGKKCSANGDTTSFETSRPRSPRRRRGRRASARRVREEANEPREATLGRVRKAPGARRSSNGKSLTWHFTSSCPPPR